nr:class I SAM-dependent methyltransferase [Tunicatimonas sp. TK19036]
MLEELRELGSIPAYIIEIIDKNISTTSSLKVVDFGCGKGAVLIKLALRFEICGLGIDIVPEFILSAQQFAQLNGVDHKVTFKIEDITESVVTIKDQDILIYSYDSEALGNITKTLSQLEKCLTNNGFIVFEVAFTPKDSSSIDEMPTENDVFRQIEGSGMRVIERIDWDANVLRKVNFLNNTLIQKKANELIKIHPEKAYLFKQYVANQKAECAMLENEMICSTLLLKKKK